MDHKLTAASKHAAYTEAGFSCSKPQFDKESSVFYSVKDNVFRQHEFTFSSSVTKIVSKVQFELATKGQTSTAVEVVAPIEEVKVEEQKIELGAEEVKAVEEPKVVSKKSSKKKGA